MYIYLVVNLLCSLFQGQIFSGRDHRIYLLGNPVIFWAMLIFMGLFLLLYLVYATRRQRDVKMSPELTGQLNLYITLEEKDFK